MKRIASIIISLAGLASPVTAAPRCALDVSNPAITHSVITLHTPIQGVTQYSDPSEWVYHSNQLQWKGSTDMMRHPGHVETCTPDGSNMTGPITIPFRLRNFMENGAMSWMLNGPMVRDVVFETATTPFLANPDGEAVVTGHLTLDPFLVKQQDNTNVNHAAANGWSLFQLGFNYRQANGDDASVVAYITSLWTVLDPTVPEQTQFGVLYGPYNSINVAGEFGGGSNWGVNAVQSTDPLPLAPFNTFWPLPNLQGYSYAGNPSLAHGRLEIYADRDLHHGIPGRLLSTYNLAGPCAACGLDPALIGPGLHPISVNWTVDSGPDGIPGVAFPNETLTAVFGFNVIVGDGVPPPPPQTLCTDPTATNVGGPLPCVFHPPTPPPPDWHAITGVLQELNDQIRLLLPDGKILLLGTVQ